MPNKGTGWSTTDSKTGWSICRGCLKPTSNKPKPDCPQGHVSHYERAKERTRRDYYKNRTSTYLLKMSIRQKAYNNRAREICLRHYGGKCVCIECGFSDMTKKIHGVSYLEIDHIEGGGSKDRRSKSGGTHFFHWLIQNGFPQGFRVLCRPCNSAIEPGHTVCELHKWEKDRARI